jgi:putative transposase
VQFVQVGFQVSERRACQIIPIHRSPHRYRSIARDQTALRMRLRDLAAARVRYGYRCLHVLLQREGWQVNHQRVYRWYRLEGLSLRVKAKKKRANHLRVPRPTAEAPNEHWSMDFMADRLSDGQRFRVCT